MFEIRRSSRVPFLVTLVVLAAALLVVACTGGGTTASDTGGATEEVAESGATVEEAAPDESAPPESSEMEGGCVVEGPLNAILWEGYADDPMVADFEKEYGIDVNVTYIGSNDEVFSKIRTKSGEFDLVPATTDISGQYIDQELVQPIDLEEIPNYQEIFDIFKELPQATREGETFGVAHTWSADPIIYNADVVVDPQQSYEALWDEDYTGQIALYDDLGSLWVGALVKGYPPFDMTEEQLAEVVDLMQAQKELDRTYWSTGDDLIRLFSSGEVVLATAWNYMYTVLKSEGVNVERLEPEEGNLGWVDVLMVPVNAEHKCAAEKWINWAISGRGGAYTAQASGYSISNSAINEFLTEEQIADLHMDDPAFVEKIILWAPVNRPMYQDAWNEVKAGVE